MQKVHGFLDVLRGWDGLILMTQFKEKAGKDKEKASIGLYYIQFLWQLIFYFMILLISSWR